MMSECWHEFLDTQVARRPEAMAISDTLGHAWRFTDLNDAVRDLAQELREAGVLPGDRVLLLSENCASVVAAFYACSRIEAVIVPCNARLTLSEIQRVVAHAEPAVILFTSQVSPEAREHADYFNAKLISGRFGQLDICVRQSNPDDILDVAAILYTTGTTGIPKGVMLTHKNIRFGGMVSAEIRGMHSGDYVYGALPLTHVFGLASIISACTYAGAHVFLEPRFVPGKLYDALNNGVTLLSAVPQMHALLMQYTKEQGFDRLNSKVLRYVSSGAAPLDPDWKRRAEAFYGVALQNGYGMTEATAGVCITRNEYGSADISCGPPFPGVDVKIDLDVPGAQDGVGEVLVRGDNIMKGYYRNPADTSQVFTIDGWMRTGDLGYLDSQMCLHISGRSKELIIHGGFNVYPPEVEAALNEHPQVIQSAVIGHTIDGDEHVIAFVQAASHDLPEPVALQNFVVKRLTGYKCPSQIVVRTDLPAAPTGKVLKHKLSALLVE